MEPRNVAENGAYRDGDHSIPEDDRLKSSSVSSGSAKSSLSEFSFDDSYQLDVNEHGSFAIGHDQSEPVSDTSQNAAAIPGSTSSLKTPPFQVMERPTEASAYRIPSYVFDTNKSSNPNAEWSTASNDSLFSIHTGNISYTKDQFNWLLKSGDLGLYGGPVDIRKSGELPPPSPRITLKPVEQVPRLSPSPEIPKSGEQIIANHFKTPSATPTAGNRTSDVRAISLPKVNGVVNRELNVYNTRIDDDKPKLEVKTKGRSSGMSEEVPVSTGVSPHQSDASGQSFAFPVLAEVDIEKSVNSGQSRTERQKKSSGQDQEGSKTPTSASPTASSSSTSLASFFSCCFKPQRA